MVLFFCQKRLNYGCHIFIISHTVERKRVIIVLLFVLHCFFVLYIKNVLFFYYTGDFEHVYRSWHATL